ncbi:MAG: hypothetical protein ACRDIY_08050 [Chloroflexota bacterium]
MPTGPTAPWALQLMLADTDGDRWIFRRDPRISRSLAVLTRGTTDGLPSFAPEVQLLYKARSPRRAKDDHDFAVARPLLSEAERAWLATALEVHAPEHPWLKEL